jgi:hypothetical protein
MVKTIGLSFLLNSCYMFDFMKRKHQNDSSEGSSLEVLGDDLGAKAGARDEAALAAVYAVPAVKLPAAIRPDPDLLARRLLRQFRPEGATLARVIGDVENYKLLLGGASQDFSTAPASGYDATSVLAAMKVAGHVCEGLVAPTGWEHPGWSTILPSAVGDVRTNLQFLAQRILGVSSSTISSSKLDVLEDLFESSNTDNVLNFDDYIAPCTALVLDAQAMLM